MLSAPIRDPLFRDANGKPDPKSLVNVPTWVAWLNSLASSINAAQPATTVTDETTYGIAKVVGTKTTYAREDHTHGTQSILGIPSYAYVSGNNATTTPPAIVDIPGLSLQLVPNAQYEFEAVLTMSSSDTAGLQIAVNFSAAGATVQANVLGREASASTFQSSNIIAFNTPSGTMFTIGSSSPGLCWIKGTITTGVNAGNLTIQFDKVSTGTSTVYINSFLKVIQTA
jgi:hypothetical protein